MLKSFSQGLKQPRILMMLPSSPSKLIIQRTSQQVFNLNNCTYRIHSCLARGKFLKYAFIYNNEVQFFQLLKQELMINIIELRKAISHLQYMTQAESICEFEGKQVQLMVMRNNNFSRLFKDIKTSQDKRVNDYLQLNRRIQRELQTRKRMFNRVSTEFDQMANLLGEVGQIIYSRFEDVSSKVKMTSIKFENAIQLVMSDLFYFEEKTKYLREPETLNLDMFIVEEYFPMDTDSSSNESNKNGDKGESTMEPEEIIRTIKIGSQRQSKQQSARVSKSSQRSSTAFSSRGSATPKFDLERRTSFKGRTFSFSGLVKTQLYITQRSTESSDGEQQSIKSRQSHIVPATQAPQKVQRSNTQQEETNKRPRQSNYQNNSQEELTSSDTSDDELPEPEETTIIKRPPIPRPSVFQPLHLIEEEKVDDDTDSLFSIQRFKSSSPPLIKLRSTRRSSILSDSGSRNSKVDNNDRNQLQKRHSQFLNVREMIRKQTGYQTPENRSEEEEGSSNDGKDAHQRRSRDNITSEEEEEDTQRDRDDFSEHKKIVNRHDKKHSFINSFTDSQHQLMQRSSQLSLNSSTNNIEDSGKIRFSHIFASQLAHRVKYSVVLDEGLIPKGKSVSGGNFNHQLFLLNQEQYFMKNSDVTTPLADKQRNKKSMSKSGRNSAHQIQQEISDSDEQLEVIENSVSKQQEEVFLIQQDLFQLFESNNQSFSKYIASTPIKEMNHGYLFSRWMKEVFQIEIGPYNELFLNLHKQEKILLIMLMKMSTTPNFSAQHQLLSEFIERSSSLISQIYLMQCKSLYKLQIGVGKVMRCFDQLMPAQLLDTNREHVIEHCLILNSKLSSLLKHLYQVEKKGFMEEKPEEVSSTFINLFQNDEESRDTPEMLQVYQELKSIKQAAFYIDSILSRVNNSMIQFIMFIMNLVNLVSTCWEVVPERIILLEKMKKFVVDAKQLLTIKYEMEIQPKHHLEQQILSFQQNRFSYFINQLQESLTSQISLDKLNDLIDVVTVLGETKIGQNWVSTIDEHLQSIVNNLIMKHIKISNVLPNLQRQTKIFLDEIKQMDAIHTKIKTYNTIYGQQQGPFSVIQEQQYLQKYFSGSQQEEYNNFLFIFDRILGQIAYLLNINQLKSEKCEQILVQIENEVGNFEKNDVITAILKRVYDLVEDYVNTD